MPCRFLEASPSCFWLVVLLGLLVSFRAAETVDVMDAAVIDVATNGDHVLTSDPQDIAVLVDAAGNGLTIIQVD